MSETDLALIYVIEQRMPGPEPGLLSLSGTMLAIFQAHGHPGVSLTVSWPEFLGCTEDDIVDTITGYYRREAERLERRARDCPSGGSQDTANAVRKFLAIEDGQAKLRELALARWAKIKA
jgi:hypothetical protein